MTDEEREASRPRFVSICFESFSVDLADAAALQRTGMDDAKLYKEFIDRVAKGKAVQEQFSIVRARSGERATLESISELIYPTGYEHGNGPKPVQPQKLGVPTPDASPLATPIPHPVAAAPADPAAPLVAPEEDSSGRFAPPLGTSYETRNVGTTIEIEPTIGANNQIIDLRFAPDTVTYAGRSKWSKGPSETEMPTFESQRVTTALTLRDRQPMLVGTPSRPPVSVIDPNSAKRVWFSFITPTVVAP